jgi:hypothetical protein
LIKDNLERELMLLEVQSYYYDKTNSENPIVVTKIKTMFESVGFKISYESSYDYIDFRMMLTYMDALRKHNRLDEALSCLDIIQTQLDKSIMSDEIRIEITLIIYSMVSNIQHRVDNHHEVIINAKKGVNFSIQHNNYDFYHFLLFRLAVAEFNTHTKEYISTLNKLILFTYTTDDYKMMKIILNTLKKQYPEMYDQLTSLEYIRKIISIAMNTKT